VDENNNFCGIEDDGEAQETDTVKRNVSNISTFKRVSKKERIEVTKQVLILGNKLMKFLQIVPFKIRVQGRSAGRIRTMGKNQ